MVSPSVYISILNWNGLEDTIECLESVFSMDYDNFHVVVVDNNSSDNSVVVLRDRFSNIHIIENKVNIGFTGGNNIAIDYAVKNGADYVWLLNNDTVVDKNCLINIVEQGESSCKIGMVSPVIYYYEDRKRKQFTGSIMNWSELKIDYPDSNTNIEDKYITGGNVCLWGTALLIKVELIKIIGSLKTEYFAYWEDTEYSLRTIYAGYTNVVCKSAIVYHKTPISLERKNKHYYYFMTRNRLLLLEEYLPIKNRNVFYYRQFAWLIKYFGNLNRFNTAEYAEAALNGYIDAYKHVTGAMTCTDVPKVNRYLLLAINKYPYFISNVISANFKIICKQLIDKIAHKCK